MLKATIVFKEVDSPDGYWCDNGHKAPALFRRLGYGQAEPTKFFCVKSKGINGTYCEPCCIIANYLARKRKENG